MTKRITLMAVLACTLAVAGCGTTSNATLTFGDKENPTRVTSVSGLESQDVANVANYGAYTNTVATKSQKKVCEIKAKDGQTISMSGVDSISCYAPEPDAIAKPVQAEGKAMQMARAIREGVGGTIKDSTPVLLGGIALADRNSQRASTERLAETQADVDKSEIAADAAEAAANREQLAAANAAALAAAKEAEALRIAAAIASASSGTE